MNRQPSQLYVIFRQRLVDFTVANDCLVDPRNIRWANRWFSEGRPAIVT